MSHINNGNCPGCLFRFNRYPDFHKGLQQWFFETQRYMPEFHVAEAGRGRVTQEMYFNRKASNAHYGESAHNYNCAIDTFFQIHGEYKLDDYLYSHVVVRLPLNKSIIWYGATDAVFKESPHFEVGNWKELRDQGIVKLVE